MGQGENNSEGNSSKEGSDKENSNIRNNKELKSPIMNAQKPKMSKVGLSDLQLSRNIRMAPTFKGMS